MTDCLFCKFCDGTIATERLHDDDLAIAFSDINPQAPLHCLVVPRKHIATLNDVTAEDAALVGHLHLIAGRLAREAGYGESGYRTVFNCNRAAGQSVWHIHLHVLAGRTLAWPPG